MYYSRKLIFFVWKINRQSSSLTSEFDSGRVTAGSGGSKNTDRLRILHYTDSRFTWDNDFVTLNTERVCTEWPKKTLNFRKNSLWLVKNYSWSRAGSGQQTNFQLRIGSGRIQICSGRVGTRYARVTKNWPMSNSDWHDPRSKETVFSLTWVQGLYEFWCKEFLVRAQVYFINPLKKPIS